MLIRPTSRQESAEFDRLRGGGLLHRVLCDVHAPADVPVDAVARAAAAGTLLSGVLRRAVVGHESAAWVHCGSCVTGGWPPDELVVLLPRQRGRTLVEPVVTRQADLAAEDVVDVAGVTVTSPARTAADIARIMPQDMAVAVLGELARCTGVRPSQVSAVLDRRLRHARGLASARDVLAAWAASPNQSSTRRPVIR